MIRFYTFGLLIALIIILPITILSSYINKFNIFEYLFNILRYGNANYNTDVSLIRDQKLKQIGI